MVLTHATNVPVRGRRRRGSSELQSHVHPRCCRFDQVCNLEKRGFLEWPPADLHGDGQIVLAESHAHGDR